MEAGGGHSWAAVRIPNNCYLVAANSYRIGHINLQDTTNFICSPNLIALCQEYDLWDESHLGFNFRKFFGNGVKEKTGNNYYNTRRLWRAMDLLSPTLQLSSKQEHFPLFHQPKEKVELQECFTILRDYYSGTSFDIFRKKNRNKPERSIAVWQCVHTDVITLSPGQPSEYGCVLWAGLSFPFTAIYTPFYLGSTTIPLGYNFAPSAFDKQSAFWIFKKLGDLCKSKYPTQMKAWKELRKQLESKEIEIQNIIIREAKNIKKNHPNQLSNYLESRSEEFTSKAVTLASEMIDSLELKHENKASE